jgi:trans-2,3-dihydro-3-hydroxyanthranilate isomerase
MNLKIKVLKVNAFTKEKNGGNPAGVLLNSPQLADKQMKNISRQLQVSETAFIYPSKKADYKTRFFSPTVEVDLCGHATIAAFYTIALRNQLLGNRQVAMTQETNVGVLPVDINFSENNKLTKVMMHQGEPVLRNVDFDFCKIADALNISDDKIDTSLPKQIVSTGLFTLPVCVKSYDTLKNIKPNFGKVTKICKKIDAGSFFVFTFETLEPKSTYHARCFCPLYGVKEDPVTGTANGAVSSYLFKNKIVGNNSFICEQGDIIGRPGRVFVEIENNTVKVGGKAIIIEEKELEV